MRKTLLITAVMLGVFLIAPSIAYANGGDDFTLTENDAAMMAQWRDIQSLPTLPPTAINPTTGSPYTTVEEFSGVNTARMAGGWGIPALNTMGTVLMGGAAIYSALQLGDYFRAKIRGDTSASITGSFVPAWKSFCATGQGLNGSGSCFGSGASWSGGNYGQWGDPAAAAYGTGSTFANSTVYWVLYANNNAGVQGVFCVTAGANCTGAHSDATAADMASADSIYLHNTALTNRSYNTTAGSLDCKAVGACVVYWRTFEQQMKVIRMESCDATCVSLANIKAQLSAIAANGAQANDLQKANESCGGFLGSATGTEDQAACRAAFNYYVNPSCDTDGSNCVGAAGTGSHTTIVGGGTGSASFIPFVLPEPQPSETYREYLDRLREKGYVGTVTISTVLTDSPLTGAEGVVSVQDTTASLGPDALPWPDNPFVVPAKDDALTIFVNSTTAPDVSPSAGDCSTCTIDWTPIEDLDVGTKFPFGVPAWVSGTFGDISFADSCPTLSIGKPSALGGGSIDIPFCSAEWEDTYRPIVFPILEALMTLAAITFLGVKLFGMGGGDSA